MKDTQQVSAYWVPPREVSRSSSPRVDIDLLARQTPGGRATPTPLPDLPSLTQLGRDDGSLHPNSLKLVLVLVLVPVLVLVLVVEVSDSSSSSITL